MPPMISLKTIGIILTLFVLQFSLVSASVGPPKFSEWFLHWRTHLQNVIPQECTAVVDNYWTGNGTYPFKCSLALDCILNYTSQSDLQGMASAAVVLGLTPTLLSSLGPSIAESSILSLERPALSLALSFGGPAISVTRILTYDDPFDAVNPSSVINLTFQYLIPSLDEHQGTGWRRWLGSRQRRWLVVAVEYILALVAIGNIIQTSLDLGWRSVSSYDCNNSYYPLIWAVVPGVIHLINVASFWLVPKGVGLPSTGNSGEGSHRLENINTIYYEDPNFWTMMTHSTAMGLAVGHLMFGTMVFSSLLFVMISDAVPVILRYALSAVICRVISQYEIARMSSRYRFERVDSLKDQGDKLDRISINLRGRRPKYISVSQK